MLKKLFICLFIAGMMMVVACSPSPSPSQNDVNSEESAVKENPSNKTNAIEKEVEEQEEEAVVENAKKRDKLFYQRLLEYFCYHHYKECFGSSYTPRIYKENSVVVDGEPTVIDSNMDGDRIVSYNMKVSGINSWEGYMKTQHPDWPFDATIHELGNNQYRITFNTPQVARWPKKGQTKEILSATRIIEYIDSE
ncbi:MAG: hypothetical protein J5637_08085 [Prevotella sp.]|nr:hypothetical protein [Prevotella sp.]